MNEHDLYRVMKDIDRKYTDELHQYAAELVTTKRMRTMKQNTKKRSAVTRLLPWNIGISAAVVACAVIAVSIGKEVIGQEKQMQVGMSGSSITDQLSVREPLPIEVRAADGIDIDMNLPENGKAEVMRSIDEAQVWIDLLKQSGEHGRETGEGFHPCLEILEMEKEYLDHDIIMCAVPYHFMQSDSGVAQHAFFGGTITESGKLTVETGMVTVSKEMRPLMLQDTEAYCICFTVPKNTVPEITGFTFNNRIYDCTAPLPDDIRSERDMTDYLAELPEYQAYAQRFTNELYLRWVEDEIQTAEESQSESIPPEDCTEVQGAAEKQETADEKRVEIAGVTEFCSPVGIADEACFLVRSEADYRAMTALYPNIDCGFAESDDYDALFLLIPTEDADTYVSVTGITVSEATGRISLFIADDSSAYRDLETFSATKIVRLYIEKDALLPEFSGEFPQKVGMNVTWDYENTYDDFSAFCEAYPTATYIEVVS